MPTPTTLRNVLAPAKLNTFLHITGRRPDGYHLLQSVFMLIDWCDTLNFELRTDGQITRNDINPSTTGPLPTIDLTVRAALALQAATGTQLGAHIELEKHIPSQAGMGGGSSDAASCLIALNRLWGLNLQRAQLQEIAQKLGADVPFFLLGGHGWVEGIGEKITPIELPKAQFLVVKPKSGVATPLIFSDPLLKRDTEAATITDFAAQPKSEVYSFGHNDLQPVAQVHCPEISKALNWLGGHGLKGRMTGSGSTVFAQMLSNVDLPKAPTGWQIRICSNLEKHPLVGWLAG